VNGVNDPDLEVRRLSITACELASRVLVDLIPRPDPQLPPDPPEVIRAQHEEAQPLPAAVRPAAGLLARAAPAPHPAPRARPAPRPRTRARGPGTSSGTGPPPAGK